MLSFSFSRFNHLIEHLTGAVKAIGPSDRRSSLNLPQTGGSLHGHVNNRRLPRPASFDIMGLKSPGFNLKMLSKMTRASILYSRYVQKRLQIVCLLLLVTTRCGGGGHVVPGTHPIPEKKTLAEIGYAIQVGAFSNLTHAVRLTETLRDRGLDAFYFVHSTGLYKVRFGNLPSRETALTRAEALRTAGIIDTYYIVGPKDYPRTERLGTNKTVLREKIVGSAKRFIGVPYTWGGSSREAGFDCSGLTMAVYQLNGLNLPRSSMAQWDAGSPVDSAQMSKADLVFFATAKGSRISHVGIYVGEGRFIHAPGNGKRIHVTSLSNVYFKNRFVGARTYL